MSKMVYSFESNGEPTIAGLNLSNMGDYTIEVSLSLEHSAGNGELGHMSAGGARSTHQETTTTVSTPTTIMAGVPSHVALTRSDDNKIVTLFTNGIKFLSTDDSSRDFVVRGGASDAVLGIFCRKDMGNFHAILGREPQCDSVSGSINYIKIYDRALSENDIAVLAVQGEHEPETAVCLCDSTNGTCYGTDDGGQNHALGQLLTLCVRCERQEFNVVSVNNLRYEQGNTGSSSKGAGRGSFLDIAIENGVEKESTSVVQRGGYLLVSTTLPERKHYSTTSPMLGRGSVSLVMTKAESQGSSGRRSLHTRPSKVRRVSQPAADKVQVFLFF